MTHRSRSGGPPKPTYASRGRTKPTLNGNGGGKGAPRKLHHPPPTDPSTTASSSTHPIQSQPTDQEILDVIYDALKDTLGSGDFIPLVQKVKSLLYEKRWLDVFEHPEPGWLEAYAGRWVPGRVLCFRDLMGSVPVIRELLLSQSQASSQINVSTAHGSDESDLDSDSSEDSDAEGVSQTNGPTASSSRDGGSTAPMEDLANTLRSTHLDDPLRILSLGGGAGSEYLAFASLLAGAQRLGSGTTNSVKGKERAILWTGVDLGAWSGVLLLLELSVKDKWNLPLGLDYIRTNLLDSLDVDTTQGPDSENEAERASTTLPDLLHTREPKLITILYTLTELFTQSRSLTLSLLSSLTSHTPPGTLLLVADSASDISEFELGKEGRKWPVYMILDMVMLSPRSASWEAVEKSDSRWYRLPPNVGTSWPTKLENTRYWYRLYRRL